MANIYYATFSDADNAERAIGALLDHGVLNSDLSLIRSAADNTAVVAQTPGESDGVYARSENDPALGHPNYADPLAPAPAHVETIPAHTVDNARLNDAEDEAKHGISTTTPADAGAGAIKGTAWGVGLGAVAALAALFVPGVGLVVGGGALAAALGTAAATAGAGAATGAVVGYLKDQGLEEHVANEYGTLVGAGGTLIAVSLPSGSCSELEGQEVLEKYGATNQQVAAHRAYLS
ncbi:hypothetical protein EON81_14325 [bacterium]|nr:MAG: hypothetical protein EON81_14325 [bacterium]